MSGIFESNNEYAFDFDESIEEIDLASLVDEENSNEMMGTIEAENVLHTNLSPKDALINSINTFGRIDISYMSKITGMQPEEITHSLEEDSVIFPNPVRYNEDPCKAEWILASHYAGGNIYELIKQAKAANLRRDTRGRFKKNIDFLKKKLPDTPDASSLYISLGAPWLPADYSKAFIKDLLEMPEEPQIEYQKYLGRWSIECKKLNKVCNEFSYGTSRMNAVSIIRHIMNCTPIKVSDQRYVANSDKPEYILNPKETLLAEEKAEIILKKWNEWIHAKAGRESRIAEIYMQKFGVGRAKYDGNILALPDVNRSVALHEHQLNCIARILLTKNTLVAHDVGAGKTYIINSAAHELHRTGLSTKTMIVCPNSTLDATIQSHLHLYPSDDEKILKIYPDDFNRNKAGMIEKIKNGDYVAIYIAYSSFDMLKMTKQYWLDEINKEIFEAKNELSIARNYGTKKSIESRIKKLHKKYDKILEEYKSTETTCFDELGITGIIVDESHNYKNITINSSIGDCITGMHAKGSEKADNMLKKIRYVQNNNENSRIVFCTGTPIVNSMADVYTIQTFLQPELLSATDTEKFSQWVQTYCERDLDSHFEIDVDCGYRFKSRYSSFHNLPELLLSLSLCSDFYHVDQKTFQLPGFSGYIDVVCPKSEAQDEYMKEIVERTEKIRNHEVKATEDNLLCVTNDGKAVSLDIRLVDENASGSDDCKINICAKNVYKEYVENDNTSQIVFCDQGTPKDTWNVYDELKFKLIEMGIPSSEIAFIHDATDKEKRREILEAVNEATIRVIIGSTSKLGIGVNVQKNLSAEHFLSIPYRTGDMKQRLGRAFRQGNSCKEVKVYRYVTEKSFDSYLYEILERKAVFISEFTSGVYDVERNCDGDLGEEVLDYATIKSLAVGDNRIRERLRISNELEKLKMAYRQRQSQLLDLQRLQSHIPDRIAKSQKAKENAMTDHKYYLDTKESISNEEREAFGEDLLYALKDNVLYSKERYYCEYAGANAKIYLPANMTSDKPYVYLIIMSDRQYRVDFDGKDQSLRGVSARIDYVLNHLCDEITDCENRINDLKAQFEETKREIKKGNKYAEMILKKTKELEQIDKELKNALN